MRVRSWGLARKWDGAGRLVKAGVTEVEVGARIMAAASFTLAASAVTI
jgi:hypothetical protein